MIVIQDGRQPLHDHRNQFFNRPAYKQVCINARNKNNSSACHTSRLHHAEYISREGRRTVRWVQQGKCYTNGSFNIYPFLSTMSCPFMFDIDGNDDDEDDESREAASCGPGLVESRLHITSFNPPQSLVRQVLLLFSFYRCGNGGTKR